MSKHPGFSAELLNLCGQMRDQSISGQDAQRLNELLAANRAARQFYLRFMSLTAALESGQAEVLSEDDATSSDSHVGLLLDLLQMEQDAQAQTVCAPTIKRTKSKSLKRTQAPARSGRLSQGLVLYLAGQAVRSTPAKWLAAAAVLALGILLAVQFTGPSAAPIVEPIAGQSTNEPGTPSHTTPVATLTATHDAQWSGGALAPGSELHAGDRLTLTQGFAEITTNDGAIAILEAPATVELTDNLNAIRLHAGKLVGICETESSKGFLVRTPHMDITDLGTRFGVDTIHRATEVHVFEGEVQASRSDAAPDAEPITLVANQAARSDVGTNAIARIDHETDRFASVRLDGTLNQSILSREIPDYLDVVDLVAGGDGTGSMGQIGLDPLTGRFVSADSPGLWEDRPGEGRFNPVNESAYIAGVFVPGQRGSVTGTPVGLALPDLPRSRGTIFGAIWCGGKHPSPTEKPYTAVIDQIDYAALGNRALYVHANCGLTLDLRAIRAAFPEHRVTRFVATANNTIDPEKSGLQRRSNIAIVVDGTALIDQEIVVAPSEGPAPIEIDIAIEEAHHLSLIVTDGGDGIVLDRIVFGNPRLILEPINE